MELSSSTWMMLAFVITFVFSIWKMYPFLVNRTLEDDDTGDDAHDYLIEHMYKVLKNSQESPSMRELHEKMVQDEEFDKEKFWRFNQNKLNQLLNKHFAKNTHLNSIEDIHKEAQ